MQRPERLDFANRTTPIHELPRLTKKLGKTVRIWRDDMTGSIASGNKIRKLEFVMADAVQKKASVIVTCGGPQSNHARATSYCARRLGMKVAIAVRQPSLQDGPSSCASGNLLVNQIFKADLHWIPFAEYQAAGSDYQPFLSRIAERYRARGERPYIIPEGASCPVGTFGYLAAVEDMQAAWAKSGAPGRAPSSLFFALGSGGTHAGLHLGMQAFDMDVESLFAINVCDDEPYFQKRVGHLIDATIEDFHLPYRRRHLNILDGHVGTGYAEASEDDLRFYSDFAASEGILLDPVYTGKAFVGMLKEIEADPKRYGDDILFLHTGGFYATFAFADRYQKVLEECGSS